MAKSYSSKYKAIVFDLDGTLYCKKNINKKFVQYFIFHLSYLKSYRMARKILPSNEYGKDFYNKLHSYAARERSCFGKKRPISKRILKGKNWYEKRFYPGFCKILSKHYKTEPYVLNTLSAIGSREIALVCYSDYSNISQRLDAIGINPDIFSHIISSEEIGILKPTARPILDYCTLKNIKPSDILIVGDKTDTDEKTALLAGTDFFRIMDCNGKRDYYDSWINLSRELNL